MTNKAVRKLRAQRGTTTTRQWAKRIRGAWRDSVQGIVKCGRLLVEAKAALDHGEFLKMVEYDLPFGERTAQMLMAIAQHKHLSNPYRGSFLPASWRTLYELSRLSEDEFEAQLQAGIINAEMQRSDITGEGEGKPQTVSVQVTQEPARTVTVPVIVRQEPPRHVTLQVAAPSDEVRKGGFGPPEEATRRGGLGDFVTRGEGPHAQRFYTDAGRRKEVAETFKNLLAVFAGDAQAVDAYRAEHAAAVAAAVVEAEGEAVH